MRLTDKDILLLKLAVSVLTVFIMVRFLIMPGMGRYQEHTIEGKELNGKIEEMQAAIDGIPELEQEIGERKKELADISAKYYDVMENRQVDELLTGLALDAELFPVSLSIGEAREEIAGAYLYGRISGELDAHAQNEKVGSEGENGSRDREEKTDGTQSGYILTVNCTMVLQGEQDLVYRFIDDIAQNYPAIQIRAMHVKERTYLDAEWNVVERPEVSFELAVYMHGLVC